MKGKGVYTGWGARCLEHSNGPDDHTGCTKNLSYKGRSKYDRTLSDAECQVQIKRWLLHGAAIPQGPDSRTKHLAVDARNIGPASEPEDLDNPPA